MMTTGQQPVEPAHQKAFEFKPNNSFVQLKQGISTQKMQFKDLNELKEFCKQVKTGKKKKRVIIDASTIANEVFSDE